MQTKWTPSHEMYLLSYSSLLSMCKVGGQAFGGLEVRTASSFTPNKEDNVFEYFSYFL